MLMKFQMFSRIWIPHFLLLLQSCSSSTLQYPGVLALDRTTISAFTWAPIRIKSAKSNKLFDINRKKKTPLIILSPTPTSIRNGDDGVCPLFYRDHDKEDSNDLLVKLRARMLPTFDKSHLQSQIPTRMSRGDGINIPLIKVMFLNQMFILGIASIFTILYLIMNGEGQAIYDHILSWSGDFESPMSALDMSQTNIRLLGGALGATPSIALGAIIEQSDKRAFATTNFSTVYMVMTLFGRRAMPPPSTETEGAPDRSAHQKLSKMDRLQPVTKWTDVVLYSAVISSMTGLCEELVFRGILPSTMKRYLFNGNTLLAYISQAALFGLGHASPNTSLQENVTVSIIQTINGLWFGALYLLSGGDVIPCIIAHAIYDFQTFLFTWMTANDQIEYAYYMSREPVPNDSKMEINTIRRKLGRFLTEEQVETCKRIFYIFDSDKNGAISKSEARKGISYLAIEGALIAPPVKMVDALFDECLLLRSKGNDLDHLPNQLRFSDFFWLYLSLRSFTDSIKFQIAG